jgi:hypothetical protein
VIVEVRQGRADAPAVRAPHTTASGLQQAGLRVRGRLGGALAGRGRRGRGGGRGLVSGLLLCAF